MNAETARDLSEVNEPGSATAAGNPFDASDWATPFGLPDFEAIRPEHYVPAFAHALKAHEAEIAAIAGSAEDRKSVV